MVRLFFNTLLCFLFQTHLFPALSAFAQDQESLVDVAFANAEALQSYDVSYRVTSIADLPSAKDELLLLKNSFQDTRYGFWDESQESARLVVEKDTTNTPVRVLFVQRFQITLEGKILSQYTQFAIWNSGELTCGTTENPNPEISSVKCSLSDLYGRFLIPCFEIFQGRLGPPFFEGFWQDHSTHWDRLREASTDFLLVSLPSGNLRMTKSFMSDHRTIEYDPVSCLVTHTGSIPIDQKTGEPLNHLASSKRLTWENVRNVYRPRSVIGRELSNGIMLDKVTELHWHQFNEESFSFPTEMMKGFNAEKGIQFLVDGQSELSKVR